MFDWGHSTYIMGVLNVTPDSFSDGGQFNTPALAQERARYMVLNGADIIDVGGQSTRPGAPLVSEAEEMQRVIPVIEALREENCLPELAPSTQKKRPEPLSGIETPISVDTFRASVAKAAIAAGANWVNDITAGTADRDMLPVVAELGVPLVLMHSRGTPQTMQTLTNYENLIADIHGALQERVEAAVQAGIDRRMLIIDPGIGFAKTHTQNLEILRRLAEFRSLGLPILVGPSRKSFIGHILSSVPRAGEINPPPPQERIWGTAAACTAAIAAGADIIRIHDLPQMRDVCRVADAIYRL